MNCNIHKYKYGIYLQNYASALRIAGKNETVTLAVNK